MNNNYKHWDDKYAPQVPPVDWGCIFAIIVGLIIVVCITFRK